MTEEQTGSISFRAAHAARVALGAGVCFVTAGVLVGLIDGLIGHAGPRTLSTALTTAGLGTAASLKLAIAAAGVTFFAFLLGLFPRFLPRWAHHFSRDRTQPRQPVVAAIANVTGGWFAVLAFSAAVAVLLSGLAKLQEANFAADLRLLLLVLAGIGAAMGGFFVAHALRRPLAALDSRLTLPWPPSASFWYLVLFAAPVSGIATYFGREYTPLLGVLTSPLHAGWLTVIAGLVALLGQEKRLARATASTALRVGMAVVLFIPLAIQVRSFSPEHPPTAAAISTLTGNVGLHAARSLTDFDGDGASGLFDGGDCAPFDPKRAPGLKDIPDNGIDENCDGEDATNIPQQKERPFRGGVPKELVRNWNVVWIVIDAVRADRVGYVNSDSALTPNLDKLAHESWAFQNAFSQSSATLLSFPSMLTGQDPAAMTWERENDRLQPVSETNTIAEWLQGKGYQTALLVNRYISGRYKGMQQGYGTVIAVHQDPLDDRGPEMPKKKKKKKKHKKQGGKQEKEASSPGVVAQSIELIETMVRKSKKPFFLTAYFGDPHAPYIHHKSDFPKTPDDEAGAYDSEIAYTDKYVGFLVDYLRHRGTLWQDTIVVVTSDHGEEFGEHGSNHHARQCYVESTHVPLVVRVPGASPAMVASKVGLVDIVPTLMELTHKDAAKSRGLSGRSLTASIKQSSEEDEMRPIFCSVLSQNKDTQAPFFRRSVRRGHYALMEEITTGRVELYNLESDPEEKHDISELAEHQSLVKSLRQELGRSHTGNLTDTRTL